MDEIIGMEGMKGYKMGNTNFNVVCYVENAVLIAENEDGTYKGSLYKFNNTCKQHSIVMSTAKTKAMTITTIPVRCKLVVDVEQIIPT